MGASIGKLVFQPPTMTLLRHTDHFWLTTGRDGERRVPVFFIDRSSATTVLFSHGNAEDLGMIREWFIELSRELNVNVLAYEYAGYGKSSAADCSEANCYADIDAAYAHLTQDRRIDPANIVLYGRSLGSGPSCYLAEKLSLAGTQWEV